MITTNVVASLAMLVSSAFALEQAGTASVCPTCYTHTVVVQPPIKTCPPLITRPLPHCDIVCVRKTATGATSDYVVPPVTVVKPTTSTVGTVTETVPGSNPACPTTATVTVTRAPSQPTPDIVCPLAPHIAKCDCAPRPTTSTVYEVYTVSTTATAYVTQDALVCAPLPTVTPMPRPRPRPTTPPIAGGDDDDGDEGGDDDDNRESSATATSCTAYATKRDRLMCLDTNGSTITAAPGPTNAIPRPPRPPMVYTSDCTVHIIDQSKPCPTRGI